MTWRHSSLVVVGRFEYHHAFVVTSVQMHALSLCEVMKAHRDVHWFWVVMSERCLAFNSCLRGTVSELAAINRVILLF